MSRAGSVWATTKSELICGIFEREGRGEGRKKQKNMK